MKQDAIEVRVGGSYSDESGTVTSMGKRTWINYRAGLDHLSNAENDFKRLAGRVFSAGCDVRDEWMRQICVNL